MSAEYLSSHSNGVILLSGGVNGPLGKALLTGNKKAARERLQFLANAFQDRFYIEIQRHGMEPERKIEAAFLDLAYEFNVPIVATNEAFFQPVKTMKPMTP